MYFPSKKKFLHFFLFNILFVPTFSFAQISTDGSVGEQQTLNGPNYQISSDLGTQQGSNLFHSFEEFNIQQGESATFSGPSSVNNIIGRVTGGNTSTINGALRSTIPDANVYLINPAGIMFGQDASLDIGGSFHVSTADYLKMGENERFTAVPVTGETLSVASPTSFGFLDNNIAPISIDGKGEITEEIALSQTTSLTVAEGKNISVVGGEVTLQNGAFVQVINAEDGSQQTIPLPLLKAPGGQVHLLSTSNMGEVSLGQPGVNTTSEGNTGKITLNNTDIDVTSAGSGSVFIQGGELFIINSTINAITLGDQTSGVVELQSNTLEFSEGGRIVANTTGSANGATVSIDTTNTASFSGSSNIRGTSGIYSNVASTTTTGSTGDISIQTGIMLLDGAAINSSTIGSGNAANIQIQTGDLTLSQGANIASATAGTGLGGSINIVANKLDLSDQAKIASDAFFESGDAGSLSIQAQEITLTNASEISSKAAISGNSGNIDINTQKLNLVSQSKITTNTTTGQGNAGKISIESTDLQLFDRAEISSITAGLGNAGDISLKMSGQSQLAESFIVSLSNSNLEGAGNAGSIEMEMDSLSLLNGAFISTSTFGEGEGGNISLSAHQTIDMKGQSSAGAPSAILSTSHGKMLEAGNAGNVKINAESISLSDGARISSSTVGQGNAGTIEIETKEASFLDGSNVSSSTSDFGNGGNVILNVAGLLQASGNHQGISAGAFSNSGGAMPGAGDAGTVEITAGSMILMDGAAITTSTVGTGAGGRISLSVNELLQVSGSDQQGKAALIVSISTGNMDDAGDAGEVKIIAGELLLLNSAQISSATFGTGDSGDVELEVKGQAQIRNSDSDQSPLGIFSSSNGKMESAGEAGNIEIQAHQLWINGKAVISSKTLGAGEGGRIQIEVAKLNLDSEGQITTGSEGLENAGEAGTILIIATDAVELKNSSITTESATAGGGKIEVQAKNLLYLQDSQITTTTRGGGGDAGNISIDPIFIVLNDSQIIANAFEGNGGNIEIVADHLISSSDSIIQASSELGIDGDITVDSPIVDFSGSLEILPTEFLDVSQLLSQRCASRNAANLSRFILIGKDGIATSPEDLQPSPDYALPAQQSVHSVPIALNSNILIAQISPKMFQIDCNSLQH